MTDQSAEVFLIEGQKKNGQWIPVSAPFFDARLARNERAVRRRMLGVPHRVRKYAPVLKGAT